MTGDLKSNTKSAGEKDIPLASHSNFRDKHEGTGVIRLTKFCSTRQRPETFHQKALISCKNNYFGGSIKLVVIDSM